MDVDKESLDELERLVKTTKIRGTKRRTAVAHGLPRSKDGRYLQEAIPMETFSDGPLLEASRKMLKDPSIDRVCLTHNWASSAHDDGANSSPVSHVILSGTGRGASSSFRAATARSARCGSGTTTTPRSSTW